MDSVKGWAENLKHNKKIFEKYKGVKTVKDVLKLAKEDGYDFTEKELLNLNLDLVAGGGSGGFWSFFQIGDNTTTVDVRTNQNTVNTEQKADVVGNNNSVSMSVNSNSNQS